MITVATQHSPSDLEMVFVVRVPRKDLIEIQLDALDRAMFSEPVVTAADVLLDLHTLAFRQQQQTSEGHS